MEHHRILSEGECWDLLATANVGRLGVVLHALPAVLPVQYYVEDQAIVMCLGGFRLPRRAAHEAVVAFSVDHIDPDTWFGWAVHAVGHSNFKYRDDGAPAECGAMHPGQIVELQPTVLTGQQLHLCPFPPAVA